MAGFLLDLRTLALPGLRAAERVPLMFLSSGTEGAIRSALFSANNLWKKKQIRMPGTINKGAGDCH
jgi:hypothetical protein